MGARAVVPHLGRHLRAAGTGVRRALGVASAALLVTAVLVAAGVVAPGLVDPGAGASTGGTYLALGDSVAFGYRPAGERPAPDYHDPASFVGYPELVGRRLGLSVTNASCPGETVASMISASQPSNGCENTNGKGGGFRTHFPLHVSYRGSQLAYAVRYLGSHHHVRLITIDIGLNDVEVCHAITADGCASPAERTSLVSEVGQGLLRIYRTLRAAGYSGPIVALTYYTSDYDDPADVAITRDLDKVISQATVAAGGSVADGYGVFERASSAHGGLPCAARLIIRLPNGTCDEHPTPVGQADLADAVIATFRLQTT
jgi:lysophospholipase L1-like esterase